MKDPSHQNLQNVAFSYLDAVSLLKKEGWTNADKDFNVLNVHRVIQSAFNKQLVDRRECQAAFDLAVRLVHRHFPKQVEERPLRLRWEDYRTFIQHGTWLADAYDESQSSPSPLQAPNDLGNLLSSCIW